jgi:hypothetical protein
MSLAKVFKHFLTRLAVHRPRSGRFTTLRLAVPSKLT